MNQTLMMYEIQKSFRIKEYFAPNEGKFQYYYLKAMDFRISFGESGLMINLPVEMNQILLLPDLNVSFLIGSYHQIC